MLIEWFGHTFIRLQVKSPQNGDSHLVIDPYQTKTAGFRQPKMEADMVLFTGADRDKKLALPDGAFVIDHPGEYEAKQVFVYGIAEELATGGPSGRVIYVIETEEMTLGHLGCLSQTELTDRQLEFLENVDVLLVPVGGSGSLNATQASRIIQQIEPRVIIPMNYQFRGSQAKFDSVDAFVKELGHIKPETVDKARITLKDLPQEETKLMIINL